MAIKPIVLPITYKSDPKGLRQAESQLKGFADGIKNAVAGATLAVAGIGAASVKAFAEFDAAMNESMAIMGNVSDTMRKEMSDAAREVAKTTTFSASQAAEAFYFLASAGLDAEQAVSAMPTVAKFAQAGMFDLATATEFLSDAQSALGLRSDDAATNLANLNKVADVLVKGNILANASVEQLSESLTNKAAASMRAFNIPLEEGVAVLATFAAQGIKGSEAGTVFNAVLRGLSQGVIRNGDEFARMNIEVYDAQGNLNNLADIIGDMESALAGMSAEEQRAALTRLGFTEETLAGTLALLGNSEAIRQYEADLLKAGGTTEEVANKQLESLMAQFTLLKNSIIDVGLTIGEQLEPTFSTFVTAMGPVVEQIGAALVPAFDELIVFVQAVVEQLPALITALTPVLPVMTDLAAIVFNVAADLLPSFVAILEVLLPIIKSFTDFLSRNSEVVTALVIAIGTFVGIIYTFNSAVNIAKLAMIAFNAVMAMNPIGLIVTAIAALVAGLIWFFTQTETGTAIWEAFSTALVGFWNDVIMPAFKAMGDFFVMLWTDYIEPFISGFQLGMGILAGLAVMLWEEALKPVLGWIGDAFLFLWETFIKPIVDGWVLIFQGLGAIFTWLWETIIMPYLQMWGAIFTWLWETIIQPIINFIGEAFTWLAEMLSPIFESIGQMWETLWNNISEFFKGLINTGIITPFEAMINGIIRGLNWMIGKVNEFKVEIPDYDIFGDWAGKTVGFNFALIDEVSLPRLAKGGIVTRPTTALIGEAGAEAIIPLSKMDQMGGATYNITINAGMGSDPVRVGEYVVSAIKRYERASGKVFASA